MAAKELDRAQQYPSAFLETEGSSLKAGLEVARRFGVPLESDLPWRGFVGTLSSPEELYASASRRRVHRYFDLGTDTTTDSDRKFRAWRQWMDQHGPVPVLVKVDANLARASSRPLDDFAEASVVGLEAGLLFGYDPDNYLVRFYRGSAFGDSGYVKVSARYAAAAVAESWGAVVAGEDFLPGERQRGSRIRGGVI
jgi:hypothetical protein